MGKTRILQPTFFVRVEINVCIDVPLPSQIAGEYVPFWFVGVD